ncbi:hypothetical protein DDD_0053 [Nonlabens dokdonensis DSW-6]|uniref:Uncharacterized protein n=1 Tax=Nonlabens dokdonensis (strain DSM 17205 / KCTC 12402 / DSW-6) TaxID=592029 RepID=L7W104_NONDD|nr:hypothetical protein DDD_0053 [Nonlabens dokdonensis DSW-6]
MSARFYHKNKTHFLSIGKVGKASDNEFWSIRLKGAFYYQDYK